jgi:hypothetical protein
MEKQRTVMKNAKQKYRIDTNKDFDLADHVKKAREAARKKREEAAGVATPPPAPPK